MGVHYDKMKITLKPGESAMDELQRYLNLHKQSDRKDSKYGLLITDLTVDDIFEGEDGLEAYCTIEYQY